MSLVGGVAVADSKIGSNRIKDNAVKSRHIDNGTVRQEDLSDGVQSKLDKGRRGPKGEPGTDGVSGYEVFTSVQDFGPGGIGGSWCGAPEANTEDEGWEVVGGGATFTPADIDAGMVVASSWPNLTDPLNPGWNVQVNKPTNHNPGNVTLYAVCVKSAD